MPVTASSASIEVTIISVNRDLGYVSGAKTNKLRSGGMTLFSVYFRNGAAVPTDGAGRPHPKLVLAAAVAAWGA